MQHNSTQANSDAKNRTQKNSDATNRTKANSDAKNRTQLNNNATNTTKANSDAKNNRTQAMRGKKKMEHNQCDKIETSDAIKYNTVMRSFCMTFVFL